MTGKLPLDGVRICDFTVVWAGQTATMYLADMGAECIKVENPFIWNPMTRAASCRPGLPGIPRSRARGHGTTARPSSR